MPLNVHEYVLGFILNKLTYLQLIPIEILIYSGFTLVALSLGCKCLITIILQKIQQKIGSWEIYNV